MKALVIALPGSKSVKNLEQSHKDVRNRFELERFTATDRSNVQAQMAEHRVEWSYPWEGESVCPETGLRLHAYQTKDRLARMACFMSHYRIWKDCTEPTLVLEDDAQFIVPLNIEREMVESGFGIIGINDPRGATRKARTFHAQVELFKHQTFIKCPIVETLDTLRPQGLAGNSAYFLMPWAAIMMVGKVDVLGAWPNDAIMCNQVVDFLGVTTKYYTKVHGRRSNLA